MHTLRLSRIRSLKNFNKRLGMEISEKYSYNTFIYVLKYHYLEVYMHVCYEEFHEVILQTSFLKQLNKSELV
jgi:hypothetical protein